MDSIRDFDAGVSNNCNIFMNSVDFIDQGIENDDDIEIPVSHQENLWYHGRLDRYAAEERLLQANKPGSFLVRESDRKPGSYVLSYLGNSGINHFRITAVCGDFYIGGRQFNSLANLISYYVHCSDLLRKERLSYPVPPPEPVNDKRRVIAILPYTKMPDTDELSFQKGDIFFVHNDMTDGWLWVTAHRTGEQGMIFRELVQDLDGNIDPNSVFSWFHPNITKPDAVDLLVKAGPGSFMVRPSDNSPGDYSLFFHINNQIQRFRIEKRGVRYFMGGRTFECLDAVINRYRKEQIVEGYTLGNPINKVSEMSALNGIKEVLHADKIYETLRECREFVGLKKSKGIRMQSYLYKRNEKNKKWKYLYFVLSSGEGSAACGNSDTHLCFYDNPKRTKPRGLIDLTCAYLYQVHDSIFGQSFCFQLVEKALPCISTVTYLAAPTQDMFQVWINSLKPLCVTQISGVSKGHKLRELRCLHLHILNARRLPLKLVPNPFFIVSLNQIKVAKTKVKSSSDLFWDEEFSFEDVPPDVLAFSVTLYNKGKRSKDSEIAAVTVDLNTLENGNELENWFQLSGITPVGEWGSLQLKIQYLHDLIMPVEEYSPLQQLILDPDMEAVKALSDVCYLDRFTLANSLYNLFVCDQKLAELLISLNREEIAKEAETATLFRSSSITTAIMDMFMKSVCTDFLVHALYDPICKLLESKISCELNPDKMDSTDDACGNAEFLLQFLDEVALSIFNAVDFCPKTLRYICGFLQRTVVSKWPHDKLVRTRVVSGFIFLRLLCPAVLNPRQYNVITDIPSANVVRSLTMVAKCLQNLANLVEFGCKEPYMEVVNPFILKNKERMIVFLDQLSNLSEKPEPEYKIKGDVAREMAILHHVCVSHLNELKVISNNQVSIKKLVTVTEMLSRHKQKYLEMMA